jgi:ribosomal protein S18 acetylase RimI-like enzyme
MHMLEKNDSPSDSRIKPMHATTGVHGIYVREAVEDDAQIIHEVVSESMELYRIRSGIPEGMLVSASETMEDIRSAISQMPVYVAVDSSGRIVGSVRISIQTATSFGIPELPSILGVLSETNVAYFCRFAVHEDRQGLGIGNLLYKAAEEKVRSMHVSSMLLHTSLRNQTMISFYKKRGFSVLYEESSRGYPRVLLGKKM